MNEKLDVMSLGVLRDLLIYFRVKDYKDCICKRLWLHPIPQFENPIKALPNVLNIEVF